MLKVNLSDDQLNENDQNSQPDDENEGSPGVTNEENKLNQEFTDNSPIENDEISLEDTKILNEELDVITTKESLSPVGIPDDQIDTGEEIIIEEEFIVEPEKPDEMLTFGDHDQFELEELVIDDEATTQSMDTVDGDNSEPSETIVLEPEEEKTEVLEVTDVAEEKLSGLENDIDADDSDEETLVMDENIPADSDEENSFTLRDDAPKTEELKSIMPGAVDEPEPEAHFSESVTQEMKAEKIAEPSSEYSDDYYEDSYSVSSGNKKWYIIGAIALIAILAVIFFVIKPFGGKTDVVEQKIDPELVRARQIQKIHTELLQDVSGTFRGQVGPVSDLFGQIPKNMKLSALLVYGNEITIETFSADRTPLAKLRQNLKKAGLFDHFTQGEVTTLRPDKDVMATFLVKANPKTVAPDSNAQFFTPSSILGQLQQLADGTGVTFKSASTTSGFQPVDYHQQARLSYALSGSDKSMIDFLSQITAANINVKIDKLSLSSISKNNVNKRRMKGRLDLYLIAPNE